MSKKVSFADRIYDRFCDDYVLKAANKDGALVQKKGLTEYRASSYRIEGLGVLTLLRATGLLGPKQEMAFFIPFDKDAPLMSVLSSHQGGKDTLEVQFPEVMLQPVRYQQFSRVLENYGKLQNQELTELWQDEALLPGSAAKSGSREELCAMLEDYLSAYIRVLEMSQPCDRTQKKKKLEEVAGRALKSGDVSKLISALASGQETDPFIKKVILGLGQ